MPLNAYNGACDGFHDCRLENEVLFCSSSSYSDRANCSVFCVHLHQSVRLSYSAICLQCVNRDLHAICDSLRVIVG